MATIQELEAQIASLENQDSSLAQRQVVAAQQQLRLLYAQETLDNPASTPSQIWNARQVLTTVRLEDTNINGEYIDPTAEALLENAASNAYQNTAEWQAAVDAYNTGGVVPYKYEPLLRHLNGYYTDGAAAPGNLAPTTANAAISQWGVDAQAGGFEKFMGAVSLAATVWALGPLFPSIPAAAAAASAATTLGTGGTVSDAVRGAAIAGVTAFAGGQAADQFGGINTLAGGAAGYAAAAATGSALSGAGLQGTIQNALLGALAGGVIGGIQEYMPYGTTGITNAQVEELANMGLTAEQMAGINDAWQNSGQLTSAQSEYLNRVAADVAANGPLGGQVSSVTDKTPAGGGLRSLTDADTYQAMRDAAGITASTGDNILDSQLAARVQEGALTSEQANIYADSVMRGNVSPTDLSAGLDSLIGTTDGVGGLRSLTDADMYQAMRDAAGITASTGDTTLDSKLAARVQEGLITPAEANTYVAAVTNGTVNPTDLSNGLDSLIDQPAARGNPLKTIGAALGAAGTVGGLLNNLGIIGGDATTQPQPPATAPPGAGARYTGPTAQSGIRYVDPGYPSDVSADARGILQFYGGPEKTYFSGNRATNFTGQGIAGGTTAGGTTTPSRGTDATSAVILQWAADNPTAGIPEIINAANSVGGTPQQLSTAFGIPLADVQNAWNDVVSGTTAAGTGTTYAGGTYTPPVVETVTPITPTARGTASSPVTPPVVETITPKNVAALDTSVAIQQWMAANPQASYTDIANAANSVGVTPQQLATAMGVPLGDVLSVWRSTGVPIASDNAAAPAGIPAALPVLSPQPMQTTKGTPFSAGGEIRGASGLSSLAPRLIQGPGDGMSDSIPAYISGGGIRANEPISVTDGEYIVSADVVSHLGNGSTTAGSKVLDGMMDRVRKARTGTKKQAPKIDARSLVQSV